jgi:uncharacterized iron-regulated protein
MSYTQRGISTGPPRTGCRGVASRVVACACACASALGLALVPGLDARAASRATAEPPSVEASRAGGDESLSRGTSAALAAETAGAEVRLLDRDHPLVGRIWSARERRFVAERELLAAAGRARFLLLGERHGNPDHHALQARLVAAAASGGRPVALVAEQLDFAQQPAIDGCRDDCVDFGAELGGRVGWAQSGWPPYGLYAAVFEAAAQARAPVYAGNPGAARVRALSRGEPASAAEAWAGTAREPLTRRGRERLVQALVAGHCGHLPAERAEPLVHAQRLRDAAMAATLAAAAGSDGIAVLIAGNGHVRRDYGIPTLLRDARTVVVGFTEVSADERSAAQYADRDAFDYLWFTARVDEPDPCEQFREHLRKLAPR